MVVRKAVKAGTYNIPNAENVGGVTITDCVASDFSTSKYLTIPYSLTSYTTTEYVFCFTTSSDITTEQKIVEAAPYVELSLVNGVIEFYRYGSYGSDKHVTIGQVSANTKYWVKEIFDGISLTKSYSYSTDGINYSSPINARDNGTETQNLFSIGCSNFFTTYFKGSIDLNECYIKVGDTYIWKGTRECTRLKAVAESVSINYYAWEFTLSATESILSYTLSETPSVGDYTYLRPYPQALRNGDVEEVGSTFIGINGVPYYRSTTADATYNGYINYRLVTT